MISEVNVPLSNLRAIVIVIVVAFHSALPYLASQPLHPFPFDVPPYRWVAFPIIDPERWFGLDLFCAWQDVNLMSLMFFLAGLFAPPSLNRKGGLTYLSERWRRIGLPFLVAAGFLSPIAYFASYRLTATDPTLPAFWLHWLALPMWPAGPAWFLWQLFTLSALAACLKGLWPQSVAGLARIAESLSDRPLAFFAGLTALSMLAYVPPAMIFSPWDWGSLGPFAIQLSRPLHYVLYFVAGFAIGSHGCDRGLLRCDGPLARHWLAWLAAAVASFGVWGGLTSLTMPDWASSPFIDRLGAALAFPVACAAGALALLAICLRWMRTRFSLFDSLSENAYGIYLIHYVPVVWLQYALVGLSFNAAAKWGIVLAAALAASWSICVETKVLIPRLFIPQGKRAMLDRLR